MVLQPGGRVGQYEIVSSLGAGGMGEVFRARDTTLGREVALKTLPPAFAHDADRLARFKREATVLASLNHPNIAAIYGFEESTSGPALVLELRLFPIPPMQGIANRDEYAVSGDGTKFLTSVPAGDAAGALITVIVNWQRAIGK